MRPPRIICALCGRPAGLFVHKASAEYRIARHKPALFADRDCGASGALVSRDHFDRTPA